MKISRSAGYALMAVGYIAMHSKKGTVLAARIATAYGIPLEYLLKILQQLVRAKVLLSKRGPRGGFLLTKPAKNITMVEIIEAVDGPLMSHFHLAKQTKNAPFSIKMEATLVTAEEVVRKIFESTSLLAIIGGGDDEDYPGPRKVPKGSNVA